MGYFGGKSQDGVFQTIINQIPPHQLYIEPFLGGGAIMLNKRPAGKSVGIELSQSAIDNFTYTVPNLEILNGNALDLLSGSGIGKNALNRSDTFIYCDPPYPHGTRGKTRYRFEMSDEDHYRLLRILKSVNCLVAISTYPNEIYELELKRWRLVEYQSVVRSGATATEHLYMNYEQPEILHDDRYLGSNANQRQDIKRRIQRTGKRLLRWETAERMKLARNILDNLSTSEIEYYLEVAKAKLPAEPGPGGKIAYCSSLKINRQNEDRG